MCNNVYLSPSSSVSRLRSLQFFCVFFVHDLLFSSAQIGLQGICVSISVIATTKDNGASG
jgi:hypothetical protein